MQYKIPVQIENEDPIVLWLSLRQLTIIMVWWWLWYAVFWWLVEVLSAEIAAIPAIIIAWIAVFIAIFKQYEMTFIPFILAILRFNINLKDRFWMKWIDSFNPLDIWIITSSSEKKEEIIDFKDKMDKINSLEDKLNKI